jgi:alkaline phosphatase D
VISRRAFLGGAAATLAIGRARPARAAVLSFGPASFDVTSTSALVWHRTDAATRVRIEYGTSATHLDRALPAVSVTNASDFTVVSELGGLTPATPYFYRAVTSEGAGGVVGHFRTAPVDAREVRLAWSGDMEAGRQPFSLLDQVHTFGPDLFLFVGDTMYADIPRGKFKPELSHYRLKHRENRSDGPLQRLLRTTPTIAIWDDHEVQNDSDRTHRARAQGRQAFREYWPVRPSGLLYRRLAWGPLVDIFVLDCRSYRSPQSYTGPGKTMLGERQKAWLLSGLAASTAVFKIVVSSVPFLVSTRLDSWHGYQDEALEILAVLKRDGVRNVIVLSADIHMAIDFPHDVVHELVAGPIAAPPHCTGSHAAARLEALQRLGRPFVCDGPNFGTLTLRPGVRPEAELAFVDQRGTVRHQRVVGAAGPGS